MLPPQALRQPDQVNRRTADHDLGQWFPPNTGSRCFASLAAPVILPGRARRAKGAEMAWRIGVDIGGTFTDVALVDEGSGRIGVVKLLTTPDDFSRAVVDGLAAGLAREAVGAAEVARLAHATTIITNALFEKKGARTGLVTTRGFRDLLELRRSSRADLYDLLQDPPDVLVPRRRRFEITERIGAAGEIVTPLAEDEIDAIAAAIRAAELDTVAVALLFSFLNDAHERRVGERLRALGESGQVVCITHLAPVASLAGTHFRVIKESAGGATVARVDAVTEAAREAEIVRMLGADGDDEAAGRHARDLLTAA
jgi:hypothetical protein